LENGQLFLETGKSKGVGLFFKKRPTPVKTQTGWRQLVTATTVAAAVTTAETATATTATAFATAAVSAATTTTATAFTTTATAAITTTTTATGGTFFTRTGDVHGQVATVNVLAVQRLDGGFSRFRGFHGDEGEATGTARELVHHQVDFDDAAVRGKQVMEVVFDRVEGKISYEQLSTH